MKTRIKTALLALTLLAAPALADSGPPAVRARTISTRESARLRSLEAPLLGELRAGIVAPATPVPAGERAALGAAESRSQDLQALRAGELHLSDHDLMVIGIVVGIVILILII